jgi:hypothetical protein
MKLIMEGWRDFLGKARKKPKPKYSSEVRALVSRGAFTTHEEAKKWLDSKQSTVELEEVDDLLARISSDISNK